ncbi:MAG: glycosyltransferase family 4 protein [Vulcanimicrobiota bacterium]
MTTLMSTGGIERNLIRLCQELTKRGHDVHLGSAKGSLVKEFEEAGGRHYDLFARTKLGLVGRLLETVRAAPRLLRLLKSLQPDVVHTQSALTNATLFAISPFWPARKRTPIISSVMGLEDRPGESKFVVQLRNFFLTMGVDRTLIIAPAIQAFLEQLPIPPERMVWRDVVGIEVPRLEAERVEKVRRALGVLPGEKAVITVGALAPRKSHELFIDTAAIICRRRKDVKFFIAGDGWRRDEHARHIKALGLKGSIRLLGVRKDILDVIAACDVLVKPGIVEGFIGITVLEAQSLKVPTAAFETEDVKLAIVNGETGLTVPKKDIHGMAEAITRLLEDSDLRHKVVEAGYQRVCERFSIESVVDGLVEQYEQERALRH